VGGQTAGAAVEQGGERRGAAGAGRKQDRGVVDDRLRGRNDAATGGNFDAAGAGDACREDIHHFLEPFSKAVAANTHLRVLI